MDVLKGKKLKKKKDIRVTLVEGSFEEPLSYENFSSALVSIKDQEQKIKIITFRHRKKTQNF